MGTCRTSGTGPALSTRVTWSAEKIWIGSEQFVIDQKKGSEPLYGPVLNQMPTDPSHISPGGSATLTRLPTFVDKDHEKKITRVDGILLIECQDLSGKAKVAKQEFNLFTFYRSATPTVHVTFGDLIFDASN